MTLMRQMPRYQCHKIVWALRIKEIKSDVMPTNLPGGSWSLYPVEDGYAPIEVSHDWFVKHKPEEGGYFVEYEDGYKSFSPQAAFESGYSPVVTLSDDDAIADLNGGPRPSKNAA